MAAVRAGRDIALARSLPPRLQSFFALNPPPLGTDRNDPSSSTAREPQEASQSQSHERLNPFQPHKNPRTGAWHPPIYSLRRQADLVKLAEQHGVADLLPSTSKSTEARMMRKKEYGLRVRGTGVGQRVKGHAWERTLKGRLDKRREAMLNMPRMIQDWKQVCVENDNLINYPPSD